VSPVLPVLPVVSGAEAVRALARWDSLGLAGELPGSFENLLDWTIGDDQPGLIYQKHVAWFNVFAHGAVNAHESLRKVLGYAADQ
jgi:hypothetical protein